MNWFRRTLLTSSYLILALAVLSCATQTVADEINLIRNSEFESNLSGWSTGRNLDRVHRTPRQSLGGDWSLAINHRDGAASTTIEQVIQEVIAPGEFEFSVNAKSQSAAGSIRLRVRFNNNAATEYETVFDIGGEDHWRKYSMTVESPNPVRAVTVFVDLLDTTDTTWMDHARLIATRNLIENGRFEQNGSWTFGGDAAISDQNSQSGSRSLVLSRQIFSGSGDDPTAVQTIPVSDQSAYLFKTHVHVDRLDVVHPGDEGANVLFQFYEQGTWIRSSQMPFFEGDSGAFMSCSTILVPPQGTDRIDIQLQIVAGTGEARFDNVRLSEVSMDPGMLVDKAGHRVAVEAPEPGTAVNVDDFASFQLAVDSVSATGINSGKTLWVPADDYQIDEILVRSGVKIRMHRQARLIRTVDGAGNSGFDSAFFRTPQNSVRQSSVIIEGGWFVHNDHTGRFMDWRGDRWVVRNLFVPAWSTPTAFARAINWFGDDTSVYHNTIIGPGGESAVGQEGFAAVLMAGGNGAIIYGNNLQGGDDAIGLFTTTVPTTATGTSIPSFDQDIRQVEIFNNILNSTGGRAFACGLAVPRDDNVVMTAVVEDIRVRNFVGTAGGSNQLIAIISVPSAIPAQRSNSTAEVRRVSVSRAIVAGNLDRPRQSIRQNEAWHARFKQWGIFLQSENGGVLSDITLDDIRVNDVVRGGFRFRTDSSAINSNVRVTNSRFDSTLQRPVCDTVTTACLYSSVFHYLIEAEPPTGINNIETAGNSFVGSATRCWDANRDGVCDTFQSSPLVSSNE